MEFLARIIPVEYNTKNSFSTPFWGVAQLVGSFSGWFYAPLWNYISTKSTPKSPVELTNPEKNGFLLHTHTFDIKKQIKHLHNLIQQLT